MHQRLKISDTTPVETFQMTTEQDSLNGSKRLTKRQQVILLSLVLLVTLIFVRFFVFRGSGCEDAPDNQTNTSPKSSKRSRKNDDAEQLKDEISQSLKSLNTNELLKEEVKMPPEPVLVAPSVERVFQCLVSPTECDICQAEAEKLTEVDWKLVNKLWYEKNSRKELPIQDPDAVAEMICVEGEPVKTELLEIYCHLGFFEFVERIISKCQRRPELEEKALKNKHILTFASAHRLSDAENEADFISFDGFPFVTPSIRELASSLDGKMSQTLYRCLVNPVTCNSKTIAAVKIRHWKASLRIWKQEAKVDSSLEDAAEIAATLFADSQQTTTELLEILLRLGQEALVEEIIKLAPEADKLLEAAQEKKHILTYVAACKVFSLTNKSVKESHLKSLLQGAFSDFETFALFVHKDIITYVRLAALALKYGRLDLLEGCMDKLTAGNLILLLVALQPFKSFNDQSAPCIQILMTKIIQIISEQKDSTDPVEKDEVIKLQLYATTFIRSQVNNYQDSSVLSECIKSFCKPLQIYI